MEVDSKVKPISARDVFETLWRCRDFELSHLWQRSIFLATFIVLQFSGYAKLGEMMVMHTCPISSHPLRFHFVCLCLAISGMIMATLWICMAKGSKAWYERYESAINDFIDHFQCNGRQCEAFSSDSVAGVTGFQYEKMAAPEELTKRTQIRFNNRSLWKTGAASYSPSRINVFIGQSIYAVWSLIGAGHLVSFGQSIVDWNATQRYRFFGVAALYLISIFATLFYLPQSKHSPIVSHQVD